MGYHHHISFKRPVFSPRPLESRGASAIVGDEISSLPQLIRFNAQENPNHVFAIQAEVQEARDPENGERRYDGFQITFDQLDRMVWHCSGWIQKNVFSSERDNGVGRQRPIAIFVESHIGLFVYLAALLSLNVPVLLISARLSSTSVLHLLKETGAEAILVSERTRRSLSSDIDGSVKVVNIEPYSAFMKYQPLSLADNSENTPRYETQPQDADERNALILHSSGTTGLPKPIFLSHRYVLGYAACHQFAPEEEIDWVNFSTLPLYHGFGLLAPCLSLSVGMTCCFPPSSIIPAAKSTLDLIKSFTCRSLMTVPSIVDDILCLSDAKERTDALGLLAELEFLAVGGGALNAKAGATLVEHNIKLLNHYGVTEIGAVAPIFRPGPDYNWRFLRLRSDLGLELHPINNSPYFRLVGYPIGWKKPFEVQDELERNEASSHVEVRILGRTDDVVVLKTGEKVQPRQLEDPLNADPMIRTAVCVGSGFFELAVIIDPKSEDTDNEAMMEHVWKLLLSINPSVDQHARILSKKAIIIKPAEKSIPRSDKGSVMRQAVHEIFKDEIREAYSAMELDSLEDGFSFDGLNMEWAIKHLIATVSKNRLSGESMGVEEDLFERGMDSLQAVRLARLLGSGLRKSRTVDTESLQIKADFIYRNPTIKRLATESARLIDAQTDINIDETDHRATRMRNLVDECITRVAQQSASQPAKYTILMTGSTGNLGAHTLAHLVRTKSINKIICLVRGRQPIPNGADLPARTEKAQSILIDRQRSAFDAAGIFLEQNEWAKIELLDLASIMEEDNEMSKARLANLADQITHILHLAWPMDFQRRLESFRPHIRLLQTLVELAQTAFLSRKLAQPIRLIFSSSIAVVRHYKEEGPNNNESIRGFVPESAIQNPLVAVPMGYAEGKWICEMYLEQAAMHLAGVEPVVVRVGQLSGPEETSGVWKTEEHIPALVQASQKIGAFPKLNGTASWIPVDRAARSLGEILMHQGNINGFLHLENPVRQPLNDIFTIMANEMRLPKPFTIPFEEWLQQATAMGEIQSLESFYRDHFYPLAGGAVTLDTTQARAVSNCLAASSAVEKELVMEYVRRWRRDGFLSY